MKANMRELIHKKAMLLIFTGYFVLTFYTVISHTPSASTYDICILIFGGTKSGLSHFDLTAIMRWLISFFPQVIVVGIWLDKELSYRFVYKIVRYGFWKSWWNSQFMSALMFSVLCSIGTFITVTFIAFVFVSNRRLHQDIFKLFIMLLLYTFYNAMLVSAMISLSTWLVKCKRVAVALLSFIFFCVAIGKVFPQSIRFLIGTYSMFNLSELVDTKSGFSILPAFTIMLLIAVASYFFGKACIKRVPYKIDF